MTGRPSNAVVGVLLAAVAMTLTIVLLSPDGPDSVRPRLPGGEKRATPVSVSKKPLWDSRDLRLLNVTGARLRGETVLVASYGPHKEHGPRLTAVEAGSGKERWRIGPGPVRGGGGMVVDSVGGTMGTSDIRYPWNPPLVVGNGGDGDWSVLASYSVPSDPENPKEPLSDAKEHGIAAFSGKDGSLQWKRRLPGETTLLSSEGDRGRRVLVGVHGRDYLDVTSYALDATRAGHTVWKHKGAWVYAFAGEDTVLGEHFGPPELHDPDREWEPGGVLENAGGTVFALDARTGKKKWDLKGRDFESTLGGAIDGHALIRTATEEQASSYSKLGRGTLLVDTESGETTDRLEMYGPECGTEGHRLLACATRFGGSLLTIRAGDHDAPVIAEAVDEVEGLDQVDSVRNGRVHVSLDGSSLALDRLGRTVGRFPGNVIASSDRFVAVMSQRRPGHLQVHRLIRPPASERR